MSRLICTQAFHCLHTKSSEEHECFVLSQNVDLIDCFPMMVQLLFFFELIIASQYAVFSFILSFTISWLLNFYCVLLSCGC